MKDETKGYVCSQLSSPESAGIRNDSSFSFAVLSACDGRFHRLAYLVLDSIHSRSQLDSGIHGHITLVLSAQHHMDVGGWPWIAFVVELFSFFER